MRNKYFILAIFLLIAGSVFTGCENNQDTAKEEVKKANQDMMDSQIQFEKEWQQYKSDTELKIDTNQKQIDDFKAAMKTTSPKFKAKYENQVLTLEQNNIELKKKLNDYKYSGKDNWYEFKRDFNREVDTVEVALNEIFKNKEQLLSDFSLGKDMINAESMIEAQHFIMLDDVNTVSGDEFDRSYPKVQIVYPLGVNSYTDNKVTESHPENWVTHKERRKCFSTITLNLDTD